MSLPWTLSRLVPDLRRPMLLGALSVGVVGGLIGAAYVSALRLLERALWPTHWSTTEHLFILIGAGAGISLITYVLGNPGSVELLVDNIHVLGGPQDLRDLRSLVPASLLTISSGGAAGPEAPLAQTAGTAAGWLAHRWHLSRDDTRALTITGMAAGFTVLFGAPLGSAVFALEILHRRGLEYYEALIPALLGSAAGLVVYVGLTGFGYEPVWHFPAAGAIHSVDFAWALACGAGAAVIAVLFTYGTAALRRVIEPIPTPLRPLLGGAVLGLLAFWSPYAVTYGETQVDPLILRDAAASVFLVAVLAKLSGTTVMLSSGWRGGFVIPLLFVGAAMGRLAHAIVPGTNEVVLMSAFMAACLVGVTKTTVGSTLAVTEMAGLQLLPTTLVASLVALFLTSNVSVIETQRAREPASASDFPLSLGGATARGRSGDGERRGPAEPVVGDDAASYDAAGRMSSSSSSSAPPSPSPPTP